MNGSLIDRVLGDAARAAGKGDRGQALDLILLAMDLAPADPAVLLRAQAIHASLPPAESGLQSAGPSPDPEKATAEFPAFSVARPVLSGAGVLQPRLASPDANVVRHEQVSRDIERALQEAAERDSAEQARRERVTAERLREAARRRQRRLLVTTYSLLALALTVGGTAVIHPALLVGARDRVLQVFDPLARAEAAYRAGDLAAAAQEGRAALEGSGNAKAAVLLGYIAWRGGDTANVRRFALEAARRDSSWGVTLTAARLLRASGEPRTAALLGFAAYERGAPSSAWIEIAQMLALADKLPAAAGLLEVARRAGLPTPDPAELSRLPVPALPPYHTR